MQNSHIADYLITLALGEASSTHSQG